MSKTKDIKAVRKFDRMAIEGFLLYLPAIIIIVGIVVYPMIFAFQMSFTNLRPTARTISNVGFANYAAILDDVKFWRSIGRSFGFTIGCMVPQLILGLMMAHLLNHPMLKFKRLFRGLTIVPWLIPPVAVAIIFKFMFNDIYGIMNQILVSVHVIDRFYPWMARENTAMLILVLASIWRGTPLMITMFLAALQGIPQDLYEAARLDGANAWEQFWSITLPLLLPVVMVSGILRFIWTFNFFDLPWIMTGGGPGEATQTTSIYAFTRAFSGYRFGEGSAISILLFLILAIFASVYFFIRHKQDKAYK